MKKTLAVTDFKARCLSILDEVARTGESVTVYRRGKPLARVLPVAGVDARHPQQRLIGSVEILGEVVAPLPVGHWEVERQVEKPRRRRAAR
jgi:prevent-host-death family protein